MTSLDEPEGSSAPRYDIDPDSYTALRLVPDHLLQLPALPTELTSL